MLLAILLALELHLLWIHQTYQHQTNPLITVRVQAGCKIISLILTVALFHLVSVKLEQWHFATSPMAPRVDIGTQGSEARDVAQLAAVLGGPENYLRYLELRNGK